MRVAHKFLTKLYGSVALLDFPSLTLMVDENKPDEPPRLAVLLLLTNGSSIRLALKYDSVEEFTDEVIDNTVIAVRQSVDEALAALVNASKNSLKNDIPTTGLPYISGKH